MAQMGMDVEAVESVGRQLKQSAASVDQIVGTLDKTVSGLSSTWDGPDAQRFAQSWPTFRKALLAAQASVSGLGQSALNNASEQREASGAKSSNGTPSGIAPLAPDSPTHPASPSISGGSHIGSTEVSALQFDKTSEQAGYDAWLKDPSVAHLKAEGQCTSWVEFRRHELDPSLSVPHGNGGQMAPASTNGPSLGGIVSFPSDGTNNFDVGHVGVVEQIGATDPRQFTISEMNVGLNGVGLGKITEGRTFTEVPGVGWRDSHGVMWPELRFLP